MHRFSLKNALVALTERALPSSLVHAIKREHYLRVLRAFSLADEPDLNVVPLLLSPGDKAIDAGANIGVYTKFLSQMVGDRGLVCSIEPIPETFSILRTNIERLGLKNVQLLSCAISDAEKTVTMEVPLLDWGAKNLYQAKIVGGDRAISRSVTVPARTLDSIAEELGFRVSFVKCDVEGHELQCLAGAKRLISEHSPAWLIEVSEDPDREASKGHRLFTSLKTAGYTACWFDGERMIRRKRGDRSVNYFFLTGEQIARVGCRIRVV